MHSALSSRDDRADAGGDALFHVFRLPACACTDSPVTAMAAVDQCLVVGTADGRVTLYHVAAPPMTQVRSSPPPELSSTPVHTFSLPSNRPVSQLIVLRECHLLLVNAGDRVLVYRLPSQPFDARSPEGPVSVVVVAQLPALVDLLAVHVRKQRHLYTLALLHRRKLCLYDLRDGNRLPDTNQSVRLAPVREVPLPDGVRCFEWCGKNAILGFRRSYIYLQLSSAATEEVAAVGKSSEPFLRATHPASEVLMGLDGTCVRTLPDGTAAPGQSTFMWLRDVDSRTVAYSHPFLCAFRSTPPASQRRGRDQHAQAVTVDVRMPLLTTLPLEKTAPSSAPSGGVPSTVCGGVTLPCEIVTCITHSGLDDVVDFDGRNGATSSDKANFSVEDGIAVATDTGSVFLLVPAPLKRQAVHLAAEYGYQAAELLCELSAWRATPSDRQLVRTLAGIESFVSGRPLIAVQQLRNAQASPVVAVALFSSVLSPPHGLPSVRASHAVLVALLPAEVQAALEDAVSPTRAPGTAINVDSGALTALQGLLLSSRVTLRREVTHGNNEELLRCVDTALLQAYSLTDGESAIVDLLRDAHWCDLEASAQCLLERGLWTALATLWRSAGDLDKPLQLFRMLAIEGAPPASTTWALEPRRAARLPRPVFDAMLCIAEPGPRALIERGAPTVTELSNFVSESTSEAVMTCLADGRVRSSWPLHLSGIVCALAYIHQLSWAVEAHMSVLQKHVGWLLGATPESWMCTAVLGTLVNAQRFERVLTVVRTAFDPQEAWRSALEVETSLLLTVVEDDRIDSVDTDLHNVCWRSAALLVFTGASSSPSAGTATVPDMTAGVRAHLDRLLAQSPSIDTIAALRFFEEDELREVAVPERSILYQRLGTHEAALSMFLCEVRSVSAASQYASRVHKEQGDSSAFTQLLRLLAQPAEDDGKPRTDEILHILRTSQGVNVAEALPFLPDTLDLSDIGPLLLRGLRSSMTETHREAVYAATLASRKAREEARWVAERASGFTLDAGSVCAVCLRPLRAESVFLRYPNGVLAHPTCVADEHVCPVTHTDFSQAASVALLDKTL